jgi:Animal haem peroxidase
MDFIYVSTNIKKAIKNGGKFVDQEHPVHRTIILGDERSAMLPQFYALAVVWIKFHNLVVDEFSKLYPNLSADAKFYEARKFVIAIYQHIFYSEVLPLLVSAKAIARYRLASKKPCYDHNIDPSVTAEFTASTARYFHTFIQNSYVINFKNGTKADILLRNFNDELLGYRELAGVITGLLERPWNTLDIANEVNKKNSYMYIYSDFKFWIQTAVQLLVYCKRWSRPRFKSNRPSN